MTETKNEPGTIAGSRFATSPGRALASLVLLACLGGTPPAAAGGSSSSLRPTPRPIDSGPTEIYVDASPPPTNFVGLHDRNSPVYDANCLASGCHEGIDKEASTDPRVPGIHQMMIPYTPGYSPSKGATNSICQKCHATVDFSNTPTAGAIRKQVDPRQCALCHSPAGPGKPLYRR